MTRSLAAESRTWWGRLAVAQLPHLRDVGVVLRGSVAAQVIALAVLPVLSRLYGPATFGQFALYQAIVLMLAAVACLRLDQAILSAESAAEAMGLFQLCIVVSLVTSVVGLAAIVAFYRLAPPAWSRSGFSLYWLAPSILVTGASLAATAFLTRLGDFSASAWSRTAQAGANAAAAVAGGVVAPQGPGLIVANLIGKIAAFGVALRRLGREPVPIWRPQPREIIRLANRFRRFPEVSVLGALLSNGSGFVPTAAVYFMYGSATAGEFSMASRATLLPVGLIVIAISQVFSSHLARLLRENPRGAAPYVRATVGALALLAIPLGIAGWAASPLLFRLILGARWATAGLYAQALTLFYCSWLVAGPVSAGLVITRRLHWQLTWEAAHLLAACAAFGVGAAYHWAPAETLGVYSVVMLLTNASFVALLLGALKGAANAPSDGFEPSQEPA